MNNFMSKINWLSDASQNQQIDSHHDGRVHEYLNYLRPFADPIDGPHFPSMVFSHVRRTDLARRSLITLRDGWLPLACFFRALSPDNFIGRVAIPAEFWFVVPADWQPHVDIYRVVSEKLYGPDCLPKKIQLCGSFSPMISDVDELEEEILGFVESFGGQSAFNNIEIAATFTYPIEEVWRKYSGNTSLRGSAALLRHIHLDMTFPSVENLLSEPSFEDVLYYEFNRGRFISDSMTKHYVLARGGGLWEPSLALEGFQSKRKLPLSHSHSIEFAAWAPTRGSTFASRPPGGAENYSSFKKYFDFLLRVHPLTATWALQIMAHVSSQFPNAKRA